MDKLNELRERIDDIDMLLVSLLAERFNACLEVAEFKKANSIEIVNLSREDEIRKKVIELGSTKNIDSNFLNRLYDIIFDQSHKIQQKSLGSL